MGTSEVTDAGKNMREYMCLALKINHLSNSVLSLYTCTHVQ